MPAPAPSFAAILLADGADAKGRPLALADLNGAPALGALAYAFEQPNITKRIIVLGCEAQEVKAELNLPTWSFVYNESWQKGHVAGARVAMQSLPLVDGFFLAACDENCLRPNSLDALITRYLNVRLRLGRIVTPAGDTGHPCWPWLVDIGFRQPFVELPDDGKLATVLAANPTQVHQA